jgi:hypothetical protein
MQAAIYFYGSLRVAILNAAGFFFSCADLQCLPRFHAAARPLLKKVCKFESTNNQKYL